MCIGWYNNKPLLSFAIYCSSSLPLIQTAGAFGKLVTVRLRIVTDGVHTNYCHLPLSTIPPPTPLSLSVSPPGVSEM